MVRFEAEDDPVGLAAALFSEKVRAGLWRWHPEFHNNEARLCFDCECQHAGYTPHAHHAPHKVSMRCHIHKYNNQCSNIVVISDTIMTTPADSAAPFYFLHCFGGVVSRIRRRFRQPFLIRLGVCTTQSHWQSLHKTFNALKAFSSSVK